MSKGFKIGDLRNPFKHYEKLNYKKVTLICKKCNKEFNSDCHNPQMYPKFCKECRLFGNACVVCGKRCKIKRRCCSLKCSSIDKGLKRRGIHFGKKTLINCMNCGIEIISYQQNYTRLPKLCSTCKKYGSICKICNGKIPFGKKFCKPCVSIANKLYGWTRGNKNGMKRKEVVKRVVETSRKKGNYNIKRGFVKLWEEDKEKMMSCIHSSEKRKSKEYRDILSKKAVERFQRGDTSNCRGIYGKFHSEKNKKLLHYRSSLELLAYQLLESMNNVVKYEVEPISIKYEWENAIHRYIVDLQVWYTDNSRQLIEIKSKYRLGLEKEKVKIEAGKRYSKENGINFLIWTEEDLKQNEICKS